MRRKTKTCNFDTKEYTDRVSQRLSRLQKIKGSMEIARFLKTDREWIVDPQSKS